MIGERNGNDKLKIEGTNRRIQETFLRQNKAAVGGGGRVCRGKEVEGIDGWCGIELEGTRRGGRRGGRRRMRGTTQSASD